MTLKLIDGFSLVGNSEKSGQMTQLKMWFLIASNRFFLGMHHDGLIVHAEHTVGEQGQADNMIHMRMRQKYMTDTGHLVERQIAQSGTGINQQIVIDQERKWFAGLPRYHLPIRVS